MMRSGAASPRASRNRNPVRQENGMEEAILGEQGIPAPFPAVPNDGPIQAVAPVVVAVPDEPVTDENKALAARYVWYSRAFQPHFLLYQTCRAANPVFLSYRVAISRSPWGC